MKNFLLVVLATGTLAFAYLLYDKSQQLSLESAKVARLQGDIESLENKLKTLERVSKNTREQLRETHQSSSTQIADLEAKTAEAEKKAAEGDKSADALATIVKSPQTRDLVKQQQKLMIESLVPKLYEDFFKQLNLSPEEAKGIQDLLTQKMMAGTEINMQILAEGFDPAKVNELMKQVREGNKAIDEQLKASLGQEGFQAYDYYEKTLGERQQVSGLREQFAQANMPLNPAQEQALVTALYEERSQFPFQVNFSDQNNLDWNHFTEANLKHFAEVELPQLQQKQLARAQQVLAPEQLQTFQKMQESQLQLQKASVTLNMSILKKK